MEWKQEITIKKFVQESSDQKHLQKKLSNNCQSEMIREIKKMLSSRTSSNS